MCWFKKEIKLKRELTRPADWRRPEKTEHETCRKDRYRLAVGTNIDSSMHCNSFFPHNSISIVLKGRSGVENSALCCQRKAPTESLGVVGRTFVLRLQDVLLLRNVIIIIMKLSGTLMNYLCTFSWYWIYIRNNGNPMVVVCGILITLRGDFEYFPPQFENQYRTPSVQ